MTNVRTWFDGPPKLASYGASLTWFAAYSRDGHVVEVKGGFTTEAAALAWARAAAGGRESKGGPVTLTEAEIVALCVEAAQRAAREQFARDGHQDCGSCGGMMLAYRGNTRFSKAILAAGIGHAMDGKVYVNRVVPPDVRTQHAEVEIKATSAFRDMASAHGFDPAKQWTYTD